MVRSTASSAFATSSLLLALLAAERASAQSRIHELPFNGPATIVGDINRDGVVDVLATQFESNLNTVRLIAGKSGRAQWSIRGSARDRFGLNLASIADIDGDRRRDVLVQVKRGQVDARSGVSGKLIRSFTGSVPGAYGDALVAVSDLDGDKLPDIAIGEPFSLPGRVVIVSSKSGKTLHSLAGTANRGRFGFSLANLGDVNGDGVDDIAVGAILNGSGKVSVYSLKNYKKLYEVAGKGAGGSAFGSALRGGRDLNGNNVPDLLVAADSGAQPYVLAIEGNTGKTLQRWTGTTNSRFGESLGWFRDLTKDGRSEVVIGQHRGPAQVFDGASGKRLLSIGLPTGSIGMELFDSDFDFNDDGQPDFLARLLSQSFSRKLAVYSLKSLPFIADRPVLSTTNSETQHQILNAGAARAGSPYVVLGTVSGTKPGVRIGNVHVPLNLDGYTSLTLALANSPILPGSVGLLDAKGQAKARFQAFPQVPASLLDTVLFEHVFVVFGKNGVSFASNPTVLTLTR